MPDNLAFDKVDDFLGNISGDPPADRCGERI